MADRQPTEAELLTLARAWRDAPGAMPPADVMAALAQARERAVAQAELPARAQADRGAWGRWLVGGLTAATACTMLLLLLPGNRGGTDQQALDAFAVQQITEEFELLDDLEFLAWVATEDAANAPDTRGGAG